MTDDNKELPVFRTMADEIVEQQRCEIEELKALCNEFITVLRNIAYEGHDVDAQTLQGWALDVVGQTPFKSPAQPTDRDVRIAEAVRDWLFSKLFYGIKGCSNHSCIIEKPNGMGTNGPCHCLHDRTKANIIAGRLSSLRSINLSEVIKNV